VLRGGTGRPHRRPAQDYVAVCTLRLTDYSDTDQGVSRKHLGAKARQRGRLNGIDPRLRAASRPAVKARAHLNHFMSPITSKAGRPPMRALTKSGTWVVEWLPQICTMKGLR